MGHVGRRAFFDVLATAEVLLQGSVVAEMTVSVVFGDPVFGRQIDHFCGRSEYATYSTLSATGVREVTVSVTFGAPHFGLSVPLGRRPLADSLPGAEHGGGFSTNATLISCDGRAQIQICCCVGHPIPAPLNT